MAKKKTKKKKLITKTYFYDRHGEWIYTWANGNIIHTHLNRNKKQPKIRKKKGDSSVPGQFI